MRRPETLRRAGIVERTSAVRWIIPEDFEARAAAYDASRGRQTSMRVLSSYDLDRQVASDGATGLDRRPAGRDQCPLAKSGFGAGVRDALNRRADDLVRQGHAWRTPEGERRANANLIGTLQRKEVERAGRELAAEPGLAFVAVDDGQTVRGKLLGSVQLGSGRLATIGDGLGFSLVPWRPVIESEIGREVMGVMRGDGISWQLGRARTLGIGL